MRNILFFSTILIFGLLSSKASLSQTETQRNDFVKAAKFDDVSTVKALINQGVSPNTVDENGNPMLVLAIKDRSYKVIDLLLSSKGMDVDLSNKQGETPLMLASINGEMPTVKALILKNKAEIGGQEPGLTVFGKMVLGGQEFGVQGSGNLARG